MIPSVTPLLPFQGGGFDCVDNSTSGDGKWNNVASQLDWILAQMLPGGATGSFFYWLLCHPCMQVRLSSEEDQPSWEALWLREMYSWMGIRYVN